MAMQVLFTGCLWLALPALVFDDAMGAACSTHTAVYCDCLRHVDGFNNRIVVNDNAIVYNIAIVKNKNN